MNSSVTAVIFNNERTEVLLILRRDVPVWVLPGGGIDPGETPEQAAIREVVEETGYQVTIVRKVAEYEPPNRLARKTHFYECRILRGEPTTGQETQEVRFFQMDALPPLIPPPYKGWILDAIPVRAEVLKKTIEGISYWILLKLLFMHPILVLRFLLTKIGIHINTRQP